MQPARVVYDTPNQFDILADNDIAVASYYQPLNSFSVDQIDQAALENDLNRDQL